MAGNAPGFIGQGQTTLGNTGTLNFDQLNLDQKINKSNNIDNFIKS